MPVAATWMHLEIIILCESERERQISHEITYMQNLKYDTNEHIYETELDSQTQRTDSWLPRVSGGGEKWIGSLGLANENYYTQNG